jgi:DNA-binding MarR family transcriptional regulator
MDDEELGWVKASSYRQTILRKLHGGRKLTPKEIKDGTEYYLSHVSNTLSDLEERGLVECLTPDLRKGRLYTLTEKGEEIVRAIEDG